MARDETPEARSFPPDKLRMTGRPCDCLWCMYNREGQIGHRTDSQCCRHGGTAVVIYTLMLDPLGQGLRTSAHQYTPP